jgi:predicted dehydrogenase
MNKNTTRISRRSFIAGAATASAGFTILPSHVIAGLGYKAPGDKLNIAGIGIGGRGYINLRNVETENIVALCDVDSDYAGNSFKRWPMAKQYKDYRVMLEEQKDIDAVVIATPDHSHALPAVLAMREGKHVFLQTPLSHSVYESRVLAETAKRYGVATQMGNQGNSDEGIRRICEWIWAGAIGEITHVDAWTNRPVWPQFLQEPDRGRRVPRDLDWELFVGPASWLDYNPVYHPWTWRAWWNFGTGATGDMGTHNLDAVFKALMLGYPVSVEASSSQFNAFSPPNSAIVRYEFPRRDNLPKVGMPGVTVHWYEGGWMPPRPSELEEGDLMGDENGGCLFYGTNGKIMCGSFSQNPTLLPKSEMEHFKEPSKSIRRIFNPLEGGHEQDWVRACKEPQETRLKPSSDFAYAGPLTEMVLLGNLAIRLQSLNRKLEWDGVNMRFTNIGSNDNLRILSKSNFKVAYGNPRTNNEYITMPALPAVDEWIRHTYRNGWEQL